MIYASEYSAMYRCIRAYQYGQVLLALEPFVVNPETLEGLWFLQAMYACSGRKYD